MPWQSPIVQRIAWKEFRSQRIVWIAILAELILLQLWWVLSGHQHVDINLFSMAFVLTGCFAMTSAVLLFAGENDSQTDRFLRQLPMQSRDLLVGKVGASFLSVIAFLAMAVLLALISGGAAGRFGGTRVREIEPADPLMFLQSALGIWVWGLFYSLLIRKVLWSLVAAALTEIVLSGIIHGAVSEYRLGTWIIPLVYWTIIAAVLVASVRLMRSWVRGDEIALPRRKDQSIQAPTTECVGLPFYRWYRQAAVLGALIGGLIIPVSIAVKLAAEGAYLATLMLIVAVCVFTAIATWRVLVLLSITPSHYVTSSALRLSPMSGVGLVGAAIWSFLCAGCVVLNALQIVENLLFWSSNPITELLSASLWFVVFGIAWLFGHAFLSPQKSSSTPLWQGLLQHAQRLATSETRPLVPLLWIELRRVVPVLAGSLVIGLLTVVWESSHHERQGFFIVPLLLISILHGLMTFLPDRTQGTISFLVERGVSARRVIVTKLVIWGLSLIIFSGLMLICSPYLNRMILNGMRQDVQHEQYGFAAAVIGQFLVCSLCAAWIQRTVIAIAVGFLMALMACFWGMVTASLSAPVFWIYGVPLLLLVAALLLSANQSLLEITSWPRRFRQIMWVVSASVLSLSSFAIFRMTEVPDVSQSPEVQRLNVALSSLPATSSWISYVAGDDEGARYMATYLDSLHDDPQLASQLVQPEAMIWGGAVTTFQFALSSLKLDSPDCDLDAALTHLMKWLAVTETMGNNSRNISGFYEVLDARRVVYAAIRRWANHPAQTSQRLSRALEEYAKCRNPDAVNAMARERQDRFRKLEEQRGPDPRFPLSRWGQIVASVSGDRVRVGRLINYYSLLESQISTLTPYDYGVEYQRWVLNTRVSAAQLGVDLPYFLSNMDYPAKSERYSGAVSATAIVLKLQQHRLEKGRFPVYPLSILHDVNTTDPFVPHRLLRIEPPPTQVEGLNNGTLTEINEIWITAGPLPPRSKFSLRYSNPYGDAEIQRNRADWETPHPKTVRYHVADDRFDEDKFDQLPKVDAPQPEDLPQGAASDPEPDIQ